MTDTLMNPADLVQALEALGVSVLEMMQSANICRKTLINMKENNNVSFSTYNALFELLKRKRLEKRRQECEWLAGKVVDLFARDGDEAADQLARQIMELVKRGGANAAHS